MSSRPASVKILCRRKDCGGRAFIDLVERGEHHCVRCGQRVDGCEVSRQIRQAQQQREAA